MHRRSRDAVKALDLFGRQAPEGFDREQLLGQRKRRDPLAGQLEDAAMRFAQLAPNLRHLPRRAAGTDDGPRGCLVR